MFLEDLPRPRDIIYIQREVSLNLEQSRTRQCSHRNWSTGLDHSRWLSFCAQNGWNLFASVDEWFSPFIQVGPDEQYG